MTITTRLLIFFRLLCIAQEYFPEDRSESGTIGALLDNNEQIEVEEEEELDFQNNSLESEDTSNGIELNQMYPKLWG